MFNLLRKQAPTTITLSSHRTLEIQTGFDIILNILALWKDDLFPKEDKILMMLDMFLLKDKISDISPEFYGEIFDKMVEFISLGEEGDSSNDSPESKIMDYEIDCNAIYSFFFKVYGIDLQEIKLHWYKFVILCQDIDESSNLANLIKIRTMDMKDVPKDKIGKISSLKRKYGLEKVPKTLEERNRQWLMAR